MAFNYSKIQITSSRNLTTEVVTQTIKAAKVSGWFSEIIWKDKYMITESKEKIYKTLIRQILSYTAEIRADTKKTKQKMNNVEMRVLRMILGLTLRD
ncbi:hypothetical protein M0802_014055 [Mischocyttarus mexicanus]|nr:hypothetical protein M0802_014055 [Mischocyttarus mexicanus]